jgi:hypothetical protein
MNAGLFPFTFAALVNPTRIACLPLPVFRWLKE